MALIDGLIVGGSILGFCFTSCLCCYCCFETKPVPAHNHQEPYRSRTYGYTRGVIAMDMTTTSETAPIMQEE